MCFFKRNADVHNMFMDVHKMIMRCLYLVVYIVSVSSQSHRFQ